jgi:hypothetical protein
MLSVTDGDHALFEGFASLFNLLNPPTSLDAATQHRSQSITEHH